jgi:organic hydroperoxide reductase OsmC/OhrA
VAEVPGANPAELQTVMTETHAVCPVSKLLQSGVAELTVAPSDNLAGAAQA